MDPNGFERSSANNNIIQDDPTTKRGETRNFSRNSSGIVSDGVTSLMWQDNADNLRYEIVTDSRSGEQVHSRKLKEYSFDEASGYCSGLSLGGYSDWRLPSEIELKTIVDYSKSASSTMSIEIGTNPIFISGSTMVDDTFEYIAPDIAQILGTTKSRYWTTTKDHYFKTNEYKAISFSSYLSSATPSTAGVMCVRGEYETESKYIKDEKEGVLFDTVTGLMWQANDEQQRMLVDENNVTYSSEQQPFRAAGLQNGVEYCENLTVGGYDDWKLPNINELMTLSSDTLVRDTFNQTVSSNEQLAARDLQLGEYLSSTPLAKSAKTTDSLEEYFYFDENGNLLGNGSQITAQQRENYTGYKALDVLPWMRSAVLTETEAAFNESNDITEDFIFEGINFKACRDERFKALGSDSILFEGRFFDSILKRDLDISSDCRLARAKYCKVTGGNSVSIGNGMGCRTTKPADDKAYSASFPHGTIGENQYADVRCVRQTTDKGETFYNTLKSRVLNTAPISEKFVYDQENLTMINEINGYIYPRFYDNQDGTISDVMADVTLLQTIEDGNLDWYTADATARNIGQGWGLMTKEYTKYLNDWVSLDAITKSSMMQFNLDNGYYFSVWMNESDDTNPSYAYKWGTEYDVGMNAYSSGYTYPKENNLLYFPIKVEKPFADAGVNQETILNVVELNASRSIEPAGTTTYKWEVVKTNVTGDLNVSYPTIENPTSAVTSVTLPGNGDNKTYKFRLTLTNGSNISTDEVTVKYKADITYLADTGAILPYGDESASCIKDNVTNLVWPVVSDIENASLYNYSQISSALPSGLCGYSDWRLPTKEQFDDVKTKDYITQAAKVLFDYSFYRGDERYYLYWLNDSNGEYSSILDDTSNFAFAGRMQSNYQFIEYRMADKISTNRVWAVAGGAQ